MIIDRSNGDEVLAVLNLLKPHVTGLRLVDVIAVSSNLLASAALQYCDGDHAETARLIREACEQTIKGLERMEFEQMDVKGSA